MIDTVDSSIESTYPSKYYGAYDTTVSGVSAVTVLMDVWNAVLNNGTSFSILTIPTATSLVPLTAAEWDLYKNARYVWQENGALLYPARYYASFDVSGNVVAWYDIGSMTSVSGIPTADKLIPVSKDIWNVRSIFYRNVNGQAVAYTSTETQPSLKDQATSAQAWIQQQANLATAMGEVFTADMKAYVKAIAAIANGTDTTSTALPAQPTDIMTPS